MSRHLGASRRALFEDLERSALKPLPAEPYVLDYHVEIDKHYYSVPHQLLREKVWARITARTVEVFHRGKRVAAHVRSSSNREHTTVREHMPSSHRRYADWTPERITRQAGEIGRKTWPVVSTGSTREPMSRPGHAIVTPSRPACAWQMEKATSGNRREKGPVSGDGASLLPMVNRPRWPNVARGHRRAMRPAAASAWNEKAPPDRG